MIGNPQRFPSFLLLRPVHPREIYFISAAVAFSVALMAFSVAPMGFSVHAFRLRRTLNFG